MPVSIMSAFGGHFSGEPRAVRKVRGLGAKSGAEQNPEVGFLLFRKAADISHISESMNFASTTSLALTPPASWVERVISTLL